MSNLLEPVNSEDYDCECGGVLRRAILGGTGENPLSLHNVNGDECDVTVKNGLCNPDGSPRRYTSKSEMAKDASKSGWTNYVVHTPPPGTDKSPHTVRWDSAPAVLTAADDHKRRIEWWRQENEQFGTPIPEAYRDSQRESDSNRHLEG